MSFKLQSNLQCVALILGADVPSGLYGTRAHRLMQLINAGFSVPDSWAFSTIAVEKFSHKDFSTADSFSSDLWIRLKAGMLVCVRASAGFSEWGGPETLLNIGMNFDTCKILTKVVGHNRAYQLFFSFIEDFAIKIKNMDSEDFDVILQKCTYDALEGVRLDYVQAVQYGIDLYEQAIGAAFPLCPCQQLCQILRSMSVAWSAKSAKILRSARGAPTDAGLGLLIQAMVLAQNNIISVSGVVQFVSRATGRSDAFGHYFDNKEGLKSLKIHPIGKNMANSAIKISLQTCYPAIFNNLYDLSLAVRHVFKDEMRLKFIASGKVIWLLDVTLAERSARASIAIAVKLVKSDIISKKQGLLSIDPRRLNEVLHPQISHKARRDVLAEGIRASPGAATGRIVFSTKVNNKTIKNLTIVTTNGRASRI